MATSSRRLTKNQTIRPVDRQRMTPWLQKLLDSDEVPELSWMPECPGEFRVKWCHGSRHGYTRKDSSLFELWARHTGRYDQNKEDPKRWKANFRCALNSLKEIQEVKQKSNVKGSNPYRVYRFLSKHEAVPNDKKASRTNDSTVYSRVKIQRSDSTSQEASTPNIRPREPSFAPASSLNTFGDLAATMTPSLAPVQCSTRVSPRMLPNFDKIEPGLSNFEYGKMYRLPGHNSGYTVVPGDIKPESLPQIITSPFCTSSLPVPGYDVATMSHERLTDTPEYSDSNIEEENVELCVFELSDDSMSDLPDLEIGATLVVTSVDGQYTLQHADDVTMERDSDLFYCNFQPLTPPDSN